MKAAIFHRAGDIRVEDVPDPTVHEPTDAVVRVTLACVCGSDLWYWRGLSPHDRSGIGHEAVGVVEAVGSAVMTVREGDLVVVPFAYSDGTCPNCRNGIQTACWHGGFFGSGDSLGGQAECLRVPQADGTLVKVPAGRYDDATMRSLLTQSDVMGTGHHALTLAYAKPGDTIGVVGDGAVGLSAVLAANRLGAGRIIAQSRNPARQALAREFGATDIVSERGDAAVEAVLALTGGVGVDAAAEIGALFSRNRGIKGGGAPVRAYLPELMEDVLAGRINPGRVFDFETDLKHIDEAYAAMDERRAIKSVVRVAA